MVHYRKDPAKRNPIDYDAATIRGFISVLGRRKARKYNERWLQVWRHICSRSYFDQYGPELMPSKVARHVYDRYAVFAEAFETLKSEEHPLFKHRHNIPNLNTCIRHMLYLYDPDAHARYSWYFTGLTTRASRLATELRISVIIKYMMTNPNKQGSFTWHYTCLLPHQDIRYYQEHPADLTPEILLEARRCQLPPRRSRPRC